MVRVHTLNAEHLTYHQVASHSLQAFESVENELPDGTNRNTDEFLREDKHVIP